MSRVLFWILFAYVLFSCYLFNGYAEMNSKLQRVNDTLLKSCTNSQVLLFENEQYK